MKHTFKFTDMDCLLILEALTHLMEDEEIHPNDRQYAKRVKDKIYETVKKDKESNNEK